MTLMEIDWKNRPQKHCFMACPHDVFCECRARMQWEIQQRLAKAEEKADEKSKLLLESDDK